MLRNILLLLSIFFIMIGCVSKQTQYVDPNTVIPGAAAQPTMYDLESSAQRLMERMLAHPQFNANYNAVKSSKGGLPIVVIGNINNKTTERLQRRLDDVGDTVRTALFNSTLFEVKDDEVADAIKSRILRGADDGLENSSLVQLMGTHDVPDFIILGDFRHFSDVGGYHTYRLRLALYNLKTGTIIWEGIQTMIKL